MEGAEEAEGDSPETEEAVRAEEADKEAAKEAEPKAVKAVAPDTRTTLLPEVVICTGNLGRLPGGVATDTPVHGETLNPPSRVIIETSLPKLT